MNYSRSIDGVQDARALVEIFRRLRLALVRDQDGVATVQQAAGGQFLRQEPLVAPRESAPADIKPNGQASTELKQGEALLRRLARARRCRSGQRPARNIFTNA